MARSRRRTPIVGRTTAESNKPHKVLMHRFERRVVRRALASGDDAPHPRVFASRSAPKGGWQWLDSGCPDLPRLMRK